MKPGKPAPASRHTGNEVTNKIPAPVNMQLPSHQHIFCFSHYYSTIPRRPEGSIKVSKSSIGDKCKT